MNNRRNRIGVKTYLQYRTVLNRFVTGFAILSLSRVEMGKTRRNKKARAPTPGPSQCHPRVGTDRPASGCLPVSVLQKAATSLGVSSSLPPASLRKALEAKLGVKPNQDLSFLKALPLSPEEQQSLAKEYLRPEQPKKWSEDPDMWLDSLNIESVMKQYEEAYPQFDFMGPFPIDFAAPDPYEKSGQKKCLIREICDLRMEKALRDGKRSIGIIYNLDPHFKDGSHWVASYIDIPNHKCYYFDSYGYEPPKQIATFMKWLTTQDPKMKLMYNARRFQHSDSECGMYSLYFIIRMLAGDEFRPFCRRQPKDSVMLDLRDWLFST
jgi:hypothetical protein